MRKILIVEDDPLIAELEKDYLEASNYEATFVLDGEEGLKEAKTGKYDLLLLDVMLPGVDGFSICKEVLKTYHIPVIFVTAKNEDIDKIRGLGYGADDYIVKPFSPAELVARVNMHIRIHQKLLELNMNKKEECIEVEDLQIFPASRRVYIGGKEIILVRKEFDILYFLASNPNIVFPKERLFDEIWGEDAIGEIATVTVHINRLRDKIEVDPSSPKYIKTIWGAGYRFSVECKEKN